MRLSEKTIEDAIGHTPFHDLYPVCLVARLLCTTRRTSEGADGERVGATGYTIWKGERVSCLFADVDV